jgi:hypothetical protein
MIYSPSLSSRFLANRTLNVKNPLETKNSFVHAKQAADQNYPESKNANSQVTK